MQVLKREDFAQVKGGRTPFGYKDGISFPSIIGNDPSPILSPEAPIAAGEFVLGYPGDSGRTVPMPQPDVLGRNGTFAGLRKLHSHVAAFRRFLRDNSAAPLTPDLLAAKMIGRWPSGAPLMLAPEEDRPELGSDLQQMNNFFYAEDPKGLRCPLGSHIRRMNPRDTPLTVLDNVNLHRIIRHGNTYGQPLEEGKFEDDGQSRGIFFIFLSADAPDTYEFLKKHWIRRRKFPRSRDPAGSSLRVARRRRDVHDSHAARAPENSDAGELYPDTGRRVRIHAESERAAMAQRVTRLIQAHFITASRADAVQAGVRWRSRATARKNTASASSLTAHGAVGQDWPPAEVAAAGVFQTDRRRAAPYRPPPHAAACPALRAAPQWSSGLERRLLHHASDATYSRAGNRIVSMGDGREVGAVGSKDERRRSTPGGRCGCPRIVELVPGGFLRAALGPDIPRAAPSNAVGNRKRSPLENSIFNGDQLI